MGELNDKPMMLASGGVLPWKLSEEEIERREAAEKEGKQLPENEASNSARLAAIEWVEVNASFVKPIRLKTGPLKKPFAAFDACMDELVHHWGVDVTRYKTRLNGPKPANSPLSWVTPSDYPTKALRTGQQAIVNFRLSIDADGKVSDCYIQAATQGDGFQEAVCSKITKRAQFEPARDASGTAMAGYYIGAVRFELP